MNYGIKISQEGFDVKTCSDKDLVMSSKLNLLKTKMTGVTSSSVAHGLSYVPVFFCTYPKASGKYSFIGDDNSYCDSSNLHVYQSNTRYYIFYQETV
jgi:hypothetical protein